MPFAKQNAKFFPRRVTETVAAAGSSGSDAGAIAKPLAFVTGANDAKGVKLPSLAATDAGCSVVVVNTVADKVLKVYPPTGGKINGGSANAAVTLRAGQVGVFYQSGTAGEYFGVFDTDTTGA